MFMNTLPLVTAISEPTLLVFKTTCQSNIRQIKRKADADGVILSPHFKTHQSATVADWFKAEGVDHCTVSSFTMAEKFARVGWRNILVAFPLNVRELFRLQQLCEENTVGIFVNSLETLSYLEGVSFSTKPEVWIEIDTGQQRSGISVGEVEKIQELAEAILNTSNLTLKGFYAHPGHSYHCRSVAEIQQVHDRAKSALIELKRRLSGVFEASLCLGDTPGCSRADDFRGLDRVSCGNFVFYDLTQVAIGSCTIDQIAVAVACPIVDIHPERNQLIVYGGGVHFSKDRLEENGRVIFGKEVRISEKGTMEQAAGVLVSLSQEHGILQLPPHQTSHYRIGELVFIQPVHSCMTADLLLENHVVIVS